MIAVVDYGGGNIFSVVSALKSINQECKLVTAPKQLSGCSHIILPGVGAFSDAAKSLNQSGLFAALKQQSKKPILGICLGMQLLFEKGYEFSETDGLALIDGTVDEIHTDFKVPHIGWNSLVINDHKNAILKDISDGDYVYYSHSYMAETTDSNIIAHSEYGINIPAVVNKGNVYGTQFHPEKSGDIGIKILDNFCKIR